MAFDWHQYALEQSKDFFLESTIATPKNWKKVETICSEVWTEGGVVEPLFELIKLEDDERSQYEATLERWGTMLASMMVPTPPPAPFVSKLMTPVKFYDSHKAVYELAKSFLCPVLYHEDTDVIGICSINPVTSSVVSQVLTSYFEAQTGVKPFVSNVRANFSSWEILIAKHFQK